jgi:hypothetical protein
LVSEEYAELLLQRGWGRRGKILATLSNQTQFNGLHEPTASESTDGLKKNPMRANVHKLQPPLTKEFGSIAVLHSDHVGPFHEYLRVRIFTFIYLYLHPNPENQLTDEYTIGATLSNQTMLKNSLIRSV